MSTPHLLYNLRDSIAYFFNPELTTQAQETGQKINAQYFELDAFKSMISDSYNPACLEINISNIPPQAAKMIGGYFRTAYTTAQLSQDSGKSVEELNASIDDIFKADAQIQYLGETRQIPAGLALECKHFLETTAYLSFNKQLNHVAKTVEDLETKAAESGFKPNKAVLTYFEKPLVKNIEGRNYKFPNNLNYALHLTDFANKKSASLSEADGLLNILLYYNGEPGDIARNWLIRLMKTYRQDSLKLDEKVHKAVPELLKGLHFVKRAGRDGVYVPSLGAVRPANSYFGGYGKVEGLGRGLMLVNLDKGEEIIDKIPTSAGDVYLEWHPVNVVSRILGQIVAIYTENGRKITR